MTNPAETMREVGVEENARQLDAIVHALEIEDSFKTPLEAIAEKDATIARLSAQVSTAREALMVCDRVMHFDLRRMITWGDDYNQAVTDAANAARAALAKISEGTR